MEYLIIFLAAFCGVLLLWCLTGLLLSPVFGSDMVTFCFARGDGETLEQRVRAYGWLRDGKHDGGKLVIVDCGLSEQGLEAARILQSRHDWLDYCSEPEIADYLPVMEDKI